MFHISIESNRSVSAVKCEAHIGKVCPPLLLEYENHADEIQWYPDSFEGNWNNNFFFFLSDWQGYENKFSWLEILGWCVASYTCYTMSRWSMQCQSTSLRINILINLITTSAEKIRTSWCSNCSRQLVLSDQDNEIYLSLAFKAKKEMANSLKTNNY